MSEYEDILVPQSMRSLLLLLLLAATVLAGAGVALTQHAVGVLLATVPVTGNVVAVDTRTHRVFVVDSGSSRVSELDGRTGALVRTALVGPSAGVLGSWVGEDTCSGKLFMADGGTASVSIFAAQARPVAQVRRVPGLPEAIGVDPTRCRVYVIWHALGVGASQVGVLDTRSLRLLHRFTAGIDARAVAVDRRTGRAFIANTGDNSLDLLDGGAGRLVRTISIGLGGPIQVIVDDSARRVLVLNQNATAGSPFGAGSSYGSVAVIDADTGAVKRITVVGSGATGLAVAESTGRAFVLNALNGTVSVLDTHNGALLHTVHVGAFPVADAVDNQDRQLWVANQAGNTVSVLDTSTGIVKATVPVGIAPSALAVDGAIGRAYVLNAGGTSPGTDTWNWAPGWLRRWLPSTGPDTVPGTLSILRTTPYRP